MKFDKIFRKLQGQKEFSKKDFNADKIKQYEEVRKEMACIYEHQPSYFGPDSLNSDAFSDELKIHKDLIKRDTKECTKKSKNRDKTSKIS